MTLNSWTQQPRTGKMEVQRDDNRKELFILGPFVILKQFWENNIFKKKYLKNNIKKLFHKLFLNQIN